MNPNIRLGIADALSEHFGIANSTAFDMVPKTIDVANGFKSGNEKALHLLGVRIGMFAPKRSGAIQAVTQRTFAYNYAKSEFKGDHNRLYRIEKDGE